MTMEALEKKPHYCCSVEPVVLYPSNLNDYCTSVSSPLAVVY